MGRSLDGTFASNLTNTHIYPVLLIAVDFGSATVRMHTGIGDLVWNSNTFLGGGNFLGVTEIKETDDLTVHSVQLSLSGVPSSLISAVLNDTEYGNEATIWFGLADANGVLLGTPDQVFKGNVDTAEIEKSGDSATILVNVEHELVDFERPTERRYTSEDQRLDYASDTFFQFVPELQLKDIKWS